MPLASNLGLYSLQNIYFIINDSRGENCEFCILVVDLLEDVLEAAVVELEDGVLGAHVEGEAAV